jgi:hypothetical protein
MEPSTLFDVEVGSKAALCQWAAGKRVGQAAKNAGQKNASQNEPARQQNDDRLARFP